MSWFNIPGRSIVSRSAFYCALVTAALSVIIFVALFQVQKRVYERRLVQDAEWSIKRISQTFLGYFYAQGNWVYLEDQQRAFNLTQNVLYNYIVNAQGSIEIGVDGMQSAEVGQLKEPWEPPLPNATEPTGSTVEFSVDERLAQKFPSRLALGDRVVLISSPINCLTTREICGYLRTAVVFESISDTLKQLRLTLIVSGFLLTLLTTVVVYLTLKTFLSPLRLISENMRDLAEEISTGRRPSKSVAESLPEEAKLREAEETKFFRESLQQFTNAFERTSALESELKITRSLSDLAAQVAHDIRSPLAALEVFSSNLSELPEDRRIMLRSALTRIRDIANNLINDYQPRASFPISGVTDEVSELANEATSTCLVVSLVEDLLSEKRVQFRTRMGVAIESRFSASTYGLFVKASPIVLKRVLSNIVNNAIEAIDSRGEVTLTLDADHSFARLKIQDNGKGIPSEVLPHLMQKGFSFGKENGVGLGLYFAKSALEAWGGNVEIESSSGIGTAVTLVFPRVQPPVWFVPAIELELPQTVVIVDDDSSIHQVWHGRFLPWTRQGLRIVHFSFPEQLSTWVKVKSRGFDGPVLYLVDFEFIGSQQNGLEIISELNLQKQAVLVTSRFEEKGVLNGCHQMGVGLIPKAQAGFVPIRQKEIIIDETPPITPTWDAILIDDDPLVRDMWSTQLKRRGKRLQVYSSPSEFQNVKKDVAVQTPIFIDSSLGEEIRGEEYAKQLFAEGYTNLFLATGYPAGSFPPMSWIKGIVSKEPPEWI